MTHIRSIRRMAFFLACMGGIFLACKARSHSWYDPFCCNTTDCRPVDPSTVTEGPDGYRVVLSDRAVLVPYGDSRIRDSLDGDYHVCELPKGTVRCFYRPPGAS
jgi:hypothetical protein